MNPDTYLLKTYLEFLNRIYDRELFLSKSLNEDFHNGKPIITYLPILRMDNNFVKLGSGFDISENKHLVYFEFDRPKEDAMKLVISILKRNYEPHPKFSYEELALQLLILASENLKNDRTKTRNKNVSDTWLINEDKIIFTNIQITDVGVHSQPKIIRHRDLIYSIINNSKVQMYFNKLGHYLVFDTDFSNEIQEAINSLIKYYPSYVSDSSIKTIESINLLENKFIILGLTIEKIRKEFRFVCHTSRVNDYDKLKRNRLTKGGYYYSNFW